MDAAARDGFGQAMRLALGDGDDDSVGDAARAYFSMAGTAQQSAASQPSSCSWNPFDGNSCASQAVAAVAPAYFNAEKCVIAMQCNDVVDYGGSGGSQWS